jgi:putative transposase
MRHSQSTLKASTGHAQARAVLLAELDLGQYKPALPAALVVSLLLLASLWQASLSAACSTLKDPPRREAARRAALALLPRRQSELLEALLRALRRTLPDWLRRLPQVMALDLHQRPFYGRKNTRGATRGKKKAGTRTFFAYATLAALTPWGRFTLGLLPSRPKMRLTTLVGGLLDQAAEAGLTIDRLLLDKGFYAAFVIDLLQRRGVAFILPAIKKKATRQLYDPKTAVGFYDYSWTGALNRYDAGAKKRIKKGELQVTVRGCVARHHKSGKPLVFATWGLVGGSVAQVAQEYRRRFGIETGYRQLGQCLAVTSSRNERYRLLLVGLALLLCNLWALLHSECFSSGPRYDPLLHLRRLPLLHLAAAVAAVIAALFGGYLDEWHTQRPLSEDFMLKLDPRNYWSWQRGTRRRKSWASRWGIWKARRGG